MNEIATDKKGRVLVLDIAKGIGVFFVIAGHAPSIFPEYIRFWIGSFHMPLFFLISGYFAKPIREKLLLSKSLVKKIRKLFFPYIVYSIIWILLSYFSGCIKMSELKKNLVNTIIGTVDGVQWFFLCLFVVSVLFIIITYFVKTDILITIIVATFVVAGYSMGRLGVSNLFRFGTACYSIGFYYLGYLTHKHRESVIKRFNKYKIHIIVAVVITELVVLMLNRYVLDLMVNYEIDILFNYYIALSGCVMVYVISKICARIIVVRGCLAYIGRWSLFFYPITNYTAYFLVKFLEHTTRVSIISYCISFSLATICSLIAQKTPLILEGFVKKGR